MRQIRVKLSPEAEEVYKYINAQAPNSKLERMILNAVNQKIELIKANQHYGDGIPKKLIPKEYMKCPLLPATKVAGFFEHVN